MSTQPGSHRTVVASWVINILYYEGADEIITSYSLWMVGSEIHVLITNITVLIVYYVLV